MDIITRKSKLKEIEDLIFAFEDSENVQIDAHYFTSSCFMKNETQGILFKIKDNVLFENLLGYLDVPALLNGFQIGSTTFLSVNYGFVYDDERFHSNNIKNLNIFFGNKLERESSK